MANNPNVKSLATEATPVIGTLGNPVNANFAGPNASGELNDLPPVVQSGLDFVPLVAINGVSTGKLGIQGAQSPKTHG